MHSFKNSAFVCIFCKKNYENSNIPIDFGAQSGYYMYSGFLYTVSENGGFKMSRKAAREVAVHIVYDYGFNNDIGMESLQYFFSEDFAKSVSEDIEIYSMVSEKQHEYISAIVNGVAEKRNEIDELIKKYSVGWNLNRIYRIAMAIMRVAVYESKYVEDVSEKIAINEAVEIAKKYDTAETVSFINGILGSIVREG